MYALETLVEDWSVGSATAFGVNGTALDTPDAQPPLAISPTMDASAKEAFNLIDHSYARRHVLLE
jgi:hypothetical protein